MGSFLLFWSIVMMEWKKCLSYSKLFMICCIHLYIFIGECSKDLNCIASCTSIFPNRLKLAPSILYLAGLCGYDFISKANNVSISPCPWFTIYPKIAYKIFALFPCIFLVRAVSSFGKNLSLKFKSSGFILLWLCHKTPLRCLRNKWRTI